jgi:hypothetical protein
MSEQQKLAREKQARRAKRKKQEKQDGPQRKAVLKQKQQAQGRKAAVIGIGVMLVIAAAALGWLALEESASPGWLRQHWTSAAGVVGLAVLLPLLLMAYILRIRPQFKSATPGSDYSSGADGGYTLYSGGSSADGCDVSDAGGDGACD